MDATLSAENEPLIPAPKKGKVKNLLRVAVSLGLLAVVYGTTDLSTLLKTIGSVSIGTAFLVLFMYALSQTINCVKWWVILRGADLHRPFSETLRAYLLGMFVNTFGLGTVGGDVVRSLTIKPPRHKLGAALSSVVADRLQGLSVLATIGAISIILVRPAVLGPYAVGLSIAAIICIASGLWLGPRILTRVFSKDNRMGRMAAQIRSTFPNKIRTQLVITVIATVFHLIQISIYLVIAHELQTGISYGYLFAVVPIINIVSTLPISVSGLGVRDTLAVALLGAAGISKETSLAFSAIWVLAQTLTSAIGGFIASMMESHFSQGTPEDSPLGLDASPIRSTNTTQTPSSNTLSQSGAL